MNPAPRTIGQGEPELLTSRVVYQGRIISLAVDDVRMEDGSIARREYVRHPGAVAVVALDEDGNVVLVNQYRHPLGFRIDELPAGLLDIEGEPAVVAAQRELAEEASLSAEQWHVLVDLWTSTGCSNEAVRVFLARGLSRIDSGFQAEHEELTMTVSREPLTEAVQRVLAGTLTNGIAVSGLLAAAHARATDWEGLRAPDVSWPARPAH